MKEIILIWLDLFSLTLLPTEGMRTNFNFTNVFHFCITLECCNLSSCSVSVALPSRGHLALRSCPGKLDCTEPLGPMWGSEGTADHQHQEQGCLVLTHTLFPLGLLRIWHGSNKQHVMKTATAFLLQTTSWDALYMPGLKSKHMRR